MKIHEYQAKEILRKYSVAVPRGKVAFSAEEAVNIAKVDLQGEAWVGKGGGVKVAKSLEEVLELSNKMLGMTLVTHQTGPEGRVVKRLLIEEGINIDREFYVGITLDRAKAKNVVMVSTEGGVEIEKVAAESPEKIIKEIVEPELGLQRYQARSTIR